MLSSSCALKLIDSGVTSSQRQWYHEHVKADKLDEIKGAIAKGMPFDQYLHASAAGFQNIRVLEYLAGLHPVCLWTAYIPFTAAHQRGWIALEWLLERKCPVDSGVIIEVAKSGDMKLTQQLFVTYPSLKCTTAETADIVRMSHHQVNQWIRANPSRFEWSSSLNHTIAAQYGALQVIKWLYSNGDRWNDAAPAVARQNGFKNIVIWYEERRDHGNDSVRALST